MARASGSYPAGRWFKSDIRYHFRLVGQAVKTRPFHGCNRGSIPLRVTNVKKTPVEGVFFYVATSTRSNRLLSFAKNAVRSPDCTVSPRETPPHRFDIGSALLTEAKPPHKALGRRIPLPTALPLPLLSPVEGVFFTLLPLRGRTASRINKASYPHFETRGRTNAQGLSARMRFAVPPARSRLARLPRTASISAPRSSQKQSLHISLQAGGFR